VSVGPLLVPNWVVRANLVGGEGRGRDNTIPPIGALTTRTRTMTGMVSRDTKGGVSQRW